MAYGVRQERREKSRKAQFLVLLAISLIAVTLIVRKSARPWKRAGAFPCVTAAL